MISMWLWFQTVVFRSYNFGNKQQPQQACCRTRSSVGAGGVGLDAGFQISIPGEHATGTGIAIPLLIPLWYRVHVYTLVHVYSTRVPGAGIVVLECIHVYGIAIPVRTRYTGIESTVYCNSMLPGFEWYGILTISILPRDCTGTRIAISIDSVDSLASVVRVLCLRFSTKSTHERQKRLHQNYQNSAWHTGIAIAIA